MNPLILAPILTTLAGFMMPIQLQPSESDFQLAAGGIGYDSMAVLPNGKLYATYGSKYVRMSLPDMKTDPGYPKPIRGNWGALPESFNQGFDSMSVLSNGALYVTKGPYYVKYSDPQATIVAPGYPKLIRGNWGALPESFNQGFDTLEALKNGMTYVTKGNQYLRYRDRAATIIDAGYPKTMN